MITHKKVDVVTVGAGMTATIMAWKLTEAGLNVVSIEQGPERWANPDFQMDHDPLRYSSRHMMMVNLAKETWTWRPNPKAPSLPIRHYGAFNPGQGTGGALIHWSAMLWRFLETGFRYRTHTIERYGKGKLPPGVMVQDWPLTYFDLRPYYEQMEVDIGASGQAGNLNGTKIPGGNPFEAPRLHPYPLPPLNGTIAAGLFARACRDLGYHPFPQPAGITSRAYQDRFGNYRSGCLYCGFCTRYGCEVDAKTSPQTTWLPVALKTGRYTIRNNAHVTGITTGSSGLATGITYVDEHGREHHQPADIVMLTSYTLNNVRMLLLSRGQKHPNGIGNDRGRVGKNMTYQHWQTPARGLFKGRKFNLYTGNTATCQVIFDFNADDFDHRNVDFIGGAMIFAGLGELDPLTTVGGLPFGTNASYPHGTTPGGAPTWGKAYKDFLRDWDSIVDMTIQGESLPYEDQFFDLDPIYKDAYGQPLLRITFDWHPNDDNMYRFEAQKCAQILRAMGPSLMYVEADEPPFSIYPYQSTHMTGGAIMGSDPGNSVVNKYGQVWDTPNVFVTGACQYPQNPGMNPTGTLGALAYMAGAAIREKYLKAPRRLIT